MILIDGYNLLFHIKEEIEPIEQSRREIIDFVDSLGKKVTLLFDSNKDHAESYPQITNRNNISVAYSPTGVSADNYILELLRWEKHPNTILVITSDKRLAIQIRDLGGRTMSIEQFLQEASKVRRGPEAKQHNESPREFNRLLSIFTKRLDATDDEL